MANEMTMGLGIISIFILIGVFLPYLQDDLRTQQTNMDLAVNEDIPDSTSGVDFWDVFWSVAKMFFWTFGDLPFWLDAIFVIFRIGLLIMILKMLPFT